MNYTIYHHPQCSKSRRTLEILRGHGIEPEIVEYLRTPPDGQTLRRLLDWLGLRPRELLRRSEAAYTELGLDAPEWDDSALIDAMTRHPVLIERPIVVHGTRAVLGRPPENVEALIDGSRD